MKGPDVENAEVNSHFVPLNRRSITPTPNDCFHTVDARFRMTRRRCSGQSLHLGTGLH